MNDFNGDGFLGFFERLWWLFETYSALQGETARAFGAPPLLLLPSTWAVKPQRYRAGRYTVGVITLIEVMLFGIALVVFVIGALMMLRGR